MLIWVCDACGHAEETSPIVGNEFAYADLGFGSYGAPVDGMQDFCGDCLKKVHDALSAFEQERLSRQPEYFAERGDVIRSAVGRISNPSAPVAESLPVPIAENGSFLNRIIQTLRKPV